MQVVAVEKTGLRVEAFGPLNISVHQHVLPRNKGIFEHHNGVVLVETAGQRCLERALCFGFIGRP